MHGSLSRTEGRCYNRASYPDYARESRGERACRPAVGLYGAGDLVHNPGVASPPGHTWLPGGLSFASITPMKPGIHPEMSAATVTCACGNEFETLSTKAVIRVEICSNCHPFYTGKQKIVDTEGRVDKFMQRYGKMLKQQPEKKKK